MRLKKDARKEIHPVLEEYLECGTEDFYTPELDFPVRPPWSYNQSRDDIERNENRYFQVSRDLFFGGWSQSSGVN
jgi:hypothetical protein